jgi:hypothetical protein
VSPDRRELDTRIVGPALHVNGIRDVKMPVGTWTPSTKGCSNLPGGCHGPETW